MASHDVTLFRWSRAYGLRFFAFSVGLVALLWVLAALVGFATWALIVVVLGALVAVGCLVRLVVLPPVLLELSVDGYRMRNVRGGGVQAASWSEVESVAGGAGGGGSARRGDGPVVLVTLSGDRTTTIPVGLLGPLAIVAEREMHTRLNSAFGYRRLRDT